VRRLTIVAILALCAGCAQSQVSTTTPSALVSSTKPSPTVTSSESNDATVRTACATRVVVEMIRAVNSGDAATLERLIAPGPLGAQGFQSSGDARGPNVARFRASASRVRA
jgi:hypothetical protein